MAHDDRPFIVLTETKFSFRCIPVWDRYSPHRTRVEKKRTCDNADLKQARQMFQNRDAMVGAAPRPSTRTMVLCTGTRGIRVRSPPRQGRPRRAARAAGRRTRSLPDPVHNLLHTCGKANSREFSQVKEHLINILNFGGHEQNARSARRRRSGERRGR